MTQYTLKQAGEMLAAKQISATELAQEYLSAIDARNPAVNAYITLDSELTLAEAKAPMRASPPVMEAHSPACRLPIKIFSATPAGKAPARPKCWITSCRLTPPPWCKTCSIKAW